MPRKKIQGKVNKSLGVKQQKPTVSVSALHRMIRSVRWTESYTSLLMGVVVVIVAVLFVVSILRQTHHIQETSSISTIAPPVQPSTTPPSELKPSEKTYTVKAGDDLWLIAENYYKSGYNWVDIAKANNLANPNVIFSGNQLIIPTVTPGVKTVSSTPEINSDNTTITGTTYIVQKGDDLWHIAVRAYADGYQWAKIAQSNHLANPNLIFSGNILTIPR